jgi:acyl-coenzyme A synthetase/AMP-(fatty) acid ligase
VHPGQIEQHFALRESDIAACAAVGQPHEVFGEAVILFVMPKEGRDIPRTRLEEHAGGLAAYMRPTHYIFLAPGGMPLNRVAKTDYVRLRQLAATEVERLTALGQWDKTG